MKTQIVISKENIDSSKFIAPHANRGNNKPRNGGFWTSSITDNKKSGWIEFAEKEGIYEDTSELQMFEIEVSNNARILFIDSKDDYEKALETYGMLSDTFENPLADSGTQILDFERLMKDYDALSLTENGLRSNSHTFYGWDCESTVWFNMDCFERISSL